MMMTVTTPTTASSTTIHGSTTYNSCCCCCRPVSVDDVIDEWSAFSTSILSSYQRHMTSLFLTINVIIIMGTYFLEMTSRATSRFLPFPLSFSSFPPFFILSFSCLSFLPLSSLFPRFYFFHSPFPTPKSL